VIRILIAGIAATMLFGSAIRLIATGTEEVVASTLQPAVNGDSFEVRWREAVCGGQTWPYYDSSCLSDPNHFSGRAHVARVVSADRLPNATPPTHIAK
jgi:hypothetical protein